MKNKILFLQPRRIFTCYWIGNGLETYVTVTVDRTRCASNAAAWLEVNAIKRYSVGISEKCPLPHLAKHVCYAVPTTRCSNKPSEIKFYFKNAVWYGELFFSSASSYLGLQNHQLAQIPLVAYLVRSSIR